MTDYQTIHDQAALDALINGAPIALAYFGGEHCNVCQVMRPKVLALIQSHYPKLALGYIDAQQDTALAAQHQVFSLPSLHLYLDHRPGPKLERGFAIAQLSQAIERPYQLIYGDG